VSFVLDFTYVMFGMLTAEDGRSCPLLRMYVLTGECEVFCSVSARALFVLLLLYCSPICNVRYDRPSKKFVFAFNVTILCIILLITFCFSYSLTS